MKTAGEHRSGGLSLLVFHMMSNCCQLSGWLPFTLKKATFHNNQSSGLVQANILSIHFVRGISPRNKCEGDILSSLAGLTVVVFVSLFSGFLNVSLPWRVDWAYELCLCITLLYIHTVTHTHSPLLGTGWYRTQSSSTGADGIKGKGCSVAVALFCIFTLSTEALELYLDMQDSGQRRDKSHCHPANRGQFPPRCDQLKIWCYFQNKIQTPDLKFMDLTDQSTAEFLSLNSLTSFSLVFSFLFSRIHYKNIRLPVINTQRSELCDWCYEAVKWSRRNSLIKVWWTGPGTLSADGAEGSRCRPVCPSIHLDRSNISVCQ